MRFPVSLHKLDTMQYSGADGYAVFHPNGVPIGVRARPKFTLTIAEWMQLGRPLDLILTVSDANGQELDSKTVKLEESLERVS